MMTKTDLPLIDFRDPIRLPDGDLPYTVDEELAQRIREALPRDLTNVEDME